MSDLSINTDAHDLKDAAGQKPSRFAFIYDRNAGTVFGRNLRSWNLILLFYLVYYACLVAFFMAMMQVFLQCTIRVEQPSLTGEHNLLKLKPGLGIRPLIETHKTLIRFSSRDPNTWMPYVLNLDAFLLPYRRIQHDGVTTNSHKRCAESFAYGAVAPGSGAGSGSGSGGRVAPSSELGSNGDETDSTNEIQEDDPEKPCDFNLGQLDKCGSDPNYGYSQGEPCVLIKINKIFGWLPRVDREVENMTAPADQQPLQHPYVKCSGTNIADTENIGKIQYFPTHNVSLGVGTFQNAYFPYLGQPGYLSPIVAVKFSNLERHVVVMVTCRLMNSGDTTGAVKFELYVD